MPDEPQRDLGGSSRIPSAHYDSHKHTIRINHRNTHVYFIHLHTHTHTHTDRYLGILLQHRSNHQWTARLPQCLLQEHQPVNFSFSHREKVHLFYQFNSAVNLKAEETQWHSMCAVNLTPWWATDRWPCCWSYLQRTPHSHSVRLWTETLCSVYWQDALTHELWSAHCLQCCWSLVFPLWFSYFYAFLNYYCNCNITVTAEQV